MHEGPPEALSDLAVPEPPGEEELGRTWDAVVVGAGPAGATAAREVARRGLATLLVERETLPRTKTCGSYVNGRAASVLEAVGLGDLLEQSGAVPAREYELVAGGRSLALPLQEVGYMLSRARLDLALVQAAAEEGARVVTGRKGVLLPKASDGFRELELRSPERTTRVRGRVVLVADGLAGGADPESHAGTRVARSSRVGVGALVAPVEALPPGRIAMACAAGGYVGAASVEDGRLCIAAALASELLREAGGPAQAVRVLLERARGHVPDDLDEARWTATPPLTRRPERLAGPRTLRLGDAAGYVEPFTGEGIAWALDGGRAVADLAAAGARDWSDGIGRAWERKHAREIARRGLPARVLAAWLRWPRITRASVALLARAPGLSARLMGPLSRRMNEPVSRVT